MALKVTYINEQAPEPSVTIDSRLYITADGERLVGEGHPDAAFLLCAPGHEIPRSEFERYVLDESLETESEEVTRGESVEAPAAEREVSDAEAPAEPESGAAESKAVEGPSTTKERRQRKTKAKAA